MGMGAATSSSPALVKWWVHRPQLQLNAASSNRLQSHTSLLLLLPLSPSSSSSSHRFTVKGLGFGFEALHVSNLKRRRQQQQRVVPVRPCSMMLHSNPIVSDLYATGFSVAVAVSLLRLWEETAKRNLFDQSKLQVHPHGKRALVDDSGPFIVVQKLNRKLVHITIGLAFILCWPLFSDGYQGVALAALTPGVNIIRMLLIGSGIWKDDATVKSMSRYGDRRELLKGPLYYAATITFACIFYWRTSPIAIAAVCNLCAGDGMADIVGRRFGTVKLPYNQNKSVAGSIAMVVSGFVASLGFMHYFATFGFVQESWEMVLGFLIVSLASALVESLPISTELDDNLTVTVTSIAMGSLIF